MITGQIVLLVAVFLGMTAIILGAFGAHAFKKILTEDRLAAFETGVRYQFYSAISLLVLGFSLDFTLPLSRYACLSLFVGTILFSGSIYLLSFKDRWNVNLRFLGPVTPLGGLLMVLGWGCLFLLFLNH